MAGATKRMAAKVVRSMSSNSTETEFKCTRTDGGYSFRYDGVIHAESLPEGWEFLGIGTGWFAIRPKQ